jgi:uncharacterized membrane protein YeaQ/YmgE (transglycosylase-associated protein family)
MYRIRGYALGLALCVAGLAQGQEVFAERPPPGTTEMQPGRQILHAAVRLNDGSGHGMVEVILSWAVCGLIIGLIARLLVPGRQPLGLLRTILLGVVGAFLGGLLYWAINRGPGEPFAFSANAWHGWIFSIIGAVIVLVVSCWWQPRRATW